MVLAALRKKGGGRPAGLDVSTAATVLNLMREVSRRFGPAMLVITHDLGVVASIADRVAVAGVLQAPSNSE